MKDKEKIYCIVVDFATEQTIYWNIQEDVFKGFKDILDKAKLPYRVFIQIDKVNYEGE